MMKRLFIVLAFLSTSCSSQEQPSEACTKTLQACENDLECQNRLAPLMAACSTGTCQPQCRSAVLNVYQNKLGRAMLKSDASCIPGRDELKTCNFLLTGAQVHCSLAKLACEADLHCNSKYGVYVSECEAEASRGECSEKCRTLLSQTIATPYGAHFKNCTCTDREDQLCQNLRDNLLGSCNRDRAVTLAPGDNSIIDNDDDVTSTMSATNGFVFPMVLMITLVVYRIIFV